MLTVVSLGIGLALFRVLLASDWRAAGFRTRFLGAALALTVAAAPALAHSSGGHYIVIMRPGISMTPRKDEICVAESLKVGQGFKNANGDLLTVNGARREACRLRVPYALIVFWAL